MYGNVDYPALESNKNIFKKQRTMSEASNIYLQEESIYEPVGEREKMEPCQKKWKIPNIRGKEKETGHTLRRRSTEGGQPPRLKMLFGVASFILVLLILSLCGLGAGLFKYYKTAKEIEALKKDQKTAMSLGSFRLFNEDHNKCADIRSSSSSARQLEITASTCSSDSVSQLFRWIPGGKLLNVKARQCLGVQSSIRSLIPVILLPCDLEKSLSWVCSNVTLLGVKGQNLYFNYGNNPQGIVILYNGSGPWSRWKSQDVDGKLQAGGACFQTCKK